MMADRVSIMYRNARVSKSALLVLMLAVFAGSGWLAGGFEAAFMLGVAFFVVLYLLPRVDPRYLMALHRARPLSADHPFSRMMRALAARARLQRVPALYITPSAAPNAFAVGDHRHAAIAVSAGCLNLLDSREMAGVLAHETAHITNGDSTLSALVDLIRRMTEIAAMAGLALLLVYWWQTPGLKVPVWMPLIFLAAPALAFVLQRALSRVTEHLADARAVELTGDPQGLASALAKINRATRTLWERLTGTSMPDVLPAFLHTHPQIEGRVRRLLALGGERAELPQLIVPRRARYRAPLPRIVIAH